MRSSTSLILFFFLLICCRSLSSQSVVDSFEFFLTHQQDYGREELQDKFIYLANQVFNKHTSEEVDSISLLYQEQLNQIKDLKAKVIIHQIRCAYLSNSSFYDEAEACEQIVLDWAGEANRPDIRLLALEDLNFIYSHQSRYSEQIATIREAISVSYELDLPVDRIYYFAWLGEAFSQQARYDSAYSYLEDAISLAEEQQDAALLANVYERRSRVALDQGDYRSSITYSQQALEIAQRLDLKIRKETNLIYLGYSSFYLGDYESAIQYELEALDLYEGALDANTASIYDRLGKIYNAQEDFVTAKEYLLKAKSIYELKDYSIGIARVGLNLSKAHAGLKELDSARSVINESISIFESVDDQVNLSHAYRSLALIEKIDGRCELSSSYLINTVEILESKKKYAALSQAQLELAELAKECKSAQSYTYQAASSAYELSLSTGDVLTKQKAAKILSDYYKRLGDTEQALAFNEEYIAAYQAIYNHHNQQALVREQARFEVQLADERRRGVELSNQLLTTRNKLLNYIIWGVVGFLLLLTYLLWNIMKSRAKLVEQNTLIQNQNDKLINLNQIKNQLFGIISHDLRSPFSAIQTIPDQLRAKLADGDKEGANNIIRELENRSKSFGALLHNLLQWSLIQMDRKRVRKEQIYVEDEILDAIDLYKSLAEAKGVQISYSDTPELYALGDPDGFQTVIRNVLHNAIKYSPKQTMITLSARKEKDQILLTIRDQGFGMSEEQITNVLAGGVSSEKGTSGEKGTGLGLTVIQDIIKDNGGALKISSANPGLLVSFYFPAYAA